MKWNQIQFWHSNKSKRSEISRLIIDTFDSVDDLRAYEGKTYGDTYTEHKTLISDLVRTKTYLLIHLESSKDISSSGSFFRRKIPNIMWCKQNVIIDSFLV